MKTMKKLLTLTAVVGAVGTTALTDITEETAGPHHVEVEQFDSFGPMGVQHLGNW